MATVTDKMADAANRHSVYLLRWSKGTYSKHSKLLDELVSDLSGKLASRAPADGTFTRARLEAMLKNAEELSNQAFSALRKAVDGDFRELAEYEAGFQVQAIQEAYPIKMNLATVTGAQVHAAALSRPFQGKILRDWWAGQNAATKDQFKRALRMGFTQSESLDQITSRLRDVGGLTKRQTEAVIRTATNHLSQRARDKVRDANSELFDGEVYVATLDGRTTIQCASNDGKVFPVGKGPTPPLHMGCRSQRVPKTKSWKELGFDDMEEDEVLAERPFVADKRRVSQIPKSQRDQVIGSVTDKSYNEWLRTQPKSFVEDTLGKRKAALFRDGNLSLDKFVDRNGNELTLAELAKKESEAFREAGLDV